MEEQNINGNNERVEPNNNSYLTLYETNEVLKQLPKILNQMKNIILSTNNSLALLQTEVTIMKSEQEKFKKDVTRALNIVSNKFSNIDKIEEDLNILDEILGKRFSDIEDEIILTQQMAAKNLNEVLKFKEHWKI
ncbi:MULTISPECIES: hypothetical protein [unclassified Clostridium]|uniref:hypothetical protein n=1 Tax=unclassified Clostridium TaxID=2614128 RepID=UPI002908A5C9|nr:hypothetical protein [Clostridium sp.]MDU5107387.1 hypothetical protein [Clostridium sp.]